MLDLARANGEVRGVAGFHGVLIPPPGRAPGKIDCKVAVYHGWDDPYAKPDDVLPLAAELTESGADWPLHAFGHTLHAFMADQANQPEQGIAYNPAAAARSWHGLRRFLEECFDTP